MANLWMAWKPGLCPKVFSGSAPKRCWCWPARDCTSK
jgi:hypothetical protein